MAQRVNSYSTLSTLKKCFWLELKDGAATQFLFYLTLPLRRCIELSVDGTTYTIINFYPISIFFLTICSLYLYVFDLRYSRDGADSWIFTFSVLYYYLLSLSIVTLGDRKSMKCQLNALRLFFFIISLSFLF